MPHFISVEVGDSKGCSKTIGHTLILKVRGEDDIELTIENGSHPDSFLLKHDDPFLYLGVSKFTRICYKKSTSTHKEKCRLDIAVLD